MFGHTQQKIRNYGIKQVVFKQYFKLGIYLATAFVLLCLFSFVFLISLHKVSSSSMYPELIEGDYILVWKPTLGPRLFDIFDALKGKQVKINRLSGFRNVQRNDVIVFNSPYPQWDVWEKIEMHMLNYYVKRCIGLPGDTLTIDDGYFQIEGVDELLGNIESQKRIASANKEILSQSAYYQTFPFDSIIDWNIRTFGPLYIPHKGDSITINREKFLLYKRLIEWEQGKKLDFQDSIAVLDIEPIVGYRFLHDYYFMVGDNGLNSIDSRFWGLVPEEFIVGKAWLIYKSINPYNGKIRWERFLKIVY